MDIGLSFSIFGKKTCVMGGQAASPCEAGFAQCRQHGFSKVELVIMEGYLDPGDWKAIEQAGRWARQYGIAVHSVHGPSGWPTNGHWLGDADEDARRRNVQERRLAIQGAAMLGARYMVVEYETYGQWPYWPHGQNAEMVFPRAHDQWRRSFDELLETAAREGVALAVENIDGLPSDKLPVILSALDRKLAGVCFDSSHAAYAGRLPEELGLLAPYVIGTHLSDNDALDGPAYEDRHWRPFEGAIDWEKLVEVILKRSPCDCLMLEVLDRQDPQITDPLVRASRRIEEIAAANRSRPW